MGKLCQGRGLARLQLGGQSEQLEGCRTLRISCHDGPGWIQTFSYGIKRTTGVFGAGQLLRQSRQGGEGPEVERVAVGVQRAQPQ